MAALKSPIGIYLEHPHWFERLFAELDRRGTPYERIDATQHHFDIQPNGNRKYSLIFNRMSPSAYTRGHGHGIYYTVSYLEHLERLGITSMGSEMTLTQATCPSLVACKARSRAGLIWSGTVTCSVWPPKASRILS